MKNGAAIQPVRDLFNKSYYLEIYSVQLQPVKGLPIFFKDNLVAS